jgi:hypothetical protein
MDTVFKRIHCHVTRANNFVDTKIERFRDQNYEDIKRDCLKRNQLFEDPLFACCNSSLFYRTRVPNGIIWKRPIEIVKDPMKPKFIENVANAEDLCQGYIGDWYVTITNTDKFVLQIFFLIENLVLFHLSWFIARSDLHRSFFHST